MSAALQTFSHFPHIPPPRRVRLTTLSPHSCPYLPGRTAITRALVASEVDPLIYHEFMDAGFRRSGTMLYQPVCVGCRECVPLRVPLATFTPTKSQRRSMKRNADLILQIGRPTPTVEKFELYAKYCARWHEHAEPETPEGFERFLYQSPVSSIEFIYRIGDRLVGVGMGTCASGRSAASTSISIPTKHRDRSARSARSAKSTSRGSRASRTGTPASGFAIARR